jgi:hypothetical protein
MRSKVESGGILFVSAQYIMLASHLATIFCYPTISAANASLQEYSHKAHTDCSQAHRTCVLSFCKFLMYVL